MSPIVVSGVETERAGALKLALWGAIGLVTCYIFWATLQSPRKSK